MTATVLVFHPPYCVCDSCCRLQEEAQLLADTYRQYLACGYPCADESADEDRVRSDLAYLAGHYMRSPTLVERSRGRLFSAVELIGRLYMRGYP